MSELEPITVAERVAREALQIAEKTKVELERTQVQLGASNLRITSLEEHSVRMALESARRDAALRSDLDAQRELIRTLMDRIDHKK